MKLGRKYPVFLITVVTINLIYSCKNTSKNKELFYLNHSDTVKYVGIETCKKCHIDKFVSFNQTGMGQSFFYATKKKSVADFSKNHVVYDSFNDFYYTPFWKNNELFIKEYRMLKNDTIYSQTRKIDYIIGSGQHTNSHLILQNGYIFQAPLTWYSQKQKWDLPPGFEKGNNSRFSRIVNDECISCHNSMPVTEKNSENKFLKIGEGIDCERCHGPGKLHVDIHNKGISIKSKNGIDRTIVNPAKLDRERQIDVCQRCHLQGNAILKENKKFTDFKPGMVLSDFYEVYMPDFENSETDFIMASHAQRLKKSKCFTKSNLTCITCHNPHISVKITKTDNFNNVCKSCHGKNKCSAPPKLLNSLNNNCIKCHLPTSKTSDIPHVQIHDHYIRKNYQLQNNTESKIKGLYCVNNPKPEDKNLIKAYLSYYEKFDANEIYLINARKIMDKAKDKLSEIHYYYLNGNYKKVVEIAATINKNDINDAWAFYRIGQSYMNLKKWQHAEFYLQNSCDLQKTNFEFLYKLSQIKQNLNKFSTHEELLKKVIALNPYHTQALNDIGFYYFKNGNRNLAFRYYKNSYKTNPDFLPVLKNMFDYYIAENNKPKATEMARLILKKEPQNKVLLMFLEVDKN
ncbi:MAG: hypothetical protein HUU47_01305 [Bacteroidetes bacterium]|nr:hypothetical protein [Bacteroidota bacterium]